MGIFNFTPINKRTAQPKPLPKTNFLSKGVVQQQPKPLPSLGAAVKSGAMKLTNVGSGGAQAQAQTVATGAGYTPYQPEQVAVPVPVVTPSSGGGSSKSTPTDNTKLKQTQAAQVSPNTTFSYNPKSISGFKDTIKMLSTSLKETSNNPLESRDSKAQTKEAILKSYTQNLAKNFSSFAEFAAAQQDPEMQNLLSAYEKLGGSRNDIASNISKGSVTVTSETPNPDGSYTVSYSDGTSDVRRYTQNKDGTYTSNPAQTIDQYLGNLSAPENQQAIQDLLPEYKVQQDKIAFEQSIPNDARQFYFGSEEQDGFLTQQENLAKEKIKILERAAKDEQQNMKAQANLIIEKNQWEQQKDEAEIEKNRLAAKNYTTGLLAKLGALNTTGAAVEGLAVLEQKYQQQAQETRMAYNFENKGIEVKLNENLDQVDKNLANSVWDVKNDLSKSEEDVWKTISKMQQEADRNTLNIIDKFAQEFRSLKDKYRAQRIAAAKKYSNEFSSIVSNVDLNSLAGGGGDITTFKQYVAGEEKKAQLNYAPVAYPKLKSDFIQYLLDSSSISDDLRAVLTGLKTTIPAKVAREMVKFGITKDMIPSTKKESTTSGSSTGMSDAEFLNALKSQ